MTNEPNDEVLRAAIARMNAASGAAGVMKSLETPDDDPIMAAIRRLGLAKKGGGTPSFGELVDVEIPNGNWAARHKNPGNLRGNGPGGFRVFNTVNEGFSALVDDIVAKQEGRTPNSGLNGDSSLLQFFTKYAPAEDSNDPVRYATTVAKQLGVTIGTAIKSLDPVQLAHAVARFEERPYWDAVMAATAAKHASIPTEPAAPAVPPPSAAELMTAKPDETRRPTIDRPADGIARPRVEPQQISPSGVVTQEIESRAHFLEQEQLKREMSGADALDGGSIGPAPTGREKLMRHLGNMRFLAPNKGVISVGQSPGGVDIGGMFRFGDQVMTPIIEAGERDGFVGGSVQFMKTIGQLGYGMADQFVGAPIKLAYDNLVGNDYLLPEERSAMLTQTLANYAGLYVGLQAGKVFAGRKFAMVEPEVGSTMTELATMATAKVARGIPVKIARGTVEGLAGGATTGFIEGAANPQEGISPLDQAMSYALMSVPLGIAFEAIMPESPKRLIGSDQFKQDVARELFHFRQLELSGNTSADQAAARAMALAQDPNDIGKALLRTASTTGDPAIVRGVDPKEVVKGGTKNAPVPTFFRNADGSTDLLVGTDLTKTQRETFKLFGFFDGEPVSYLGRNYEYVGGIVDDAGQIIGHNVKDARGRAFEIMGDLEHGPDITRSSVTPDRAQVHARLYKDFKTTVPSLFDANGEVSTKHVDGPINFDKAIADYVKARNIPANEINALTKVLQTQLEDDLVRQSLGSREYAMYQRLVNDANAYERTQVTTLPDLAHAHGMYLDDSRAGGMMLRDLQTHEILNRGPFNSPQAARDFIVRSGAAKGVIMDGQGFPAVGTRLRHRSSSPINKSVYNYEKDGPLRQFSHYVNTTWVGRHFTSIRQVMLGYDAQLGTEFAARVWDPLYKAFSNKHAAMRADVVRIETFSKFLKGMSPEEIDHIVSLHETRNAQQIIGGELLNRPLTEREIRGANWFKDNRIDIRKAFEYRRAELGLRRRYGWEPDFQDRLHELQARMNIDENHVRAAGVISSILKVGKPESLSLYGIVRLAEAQMYDHLSPADYIKKNGLDGTKVVEAQRMMEDHFKDLAKQFDIPDERMLSGYYAHMRRFPGDTPFKSDPSVMAEFVHDLQRTGEMYDYNRNPIDVMMRYTNMGFNRIYVDDAWKAADDYLKTVENKYPNGDALAESMRRNYMYELRGIPRDAERMNEGSINRFLEKLGIEANIDARKHLVNMVLSLTSTKYIGFRPIQAVRDIFNILQMHYSIFGHERTAAMLNEISKWTVEMLKEEGIIKTVIPGESVSGALSREGVTPTLGPLSMMSSEELKAETLAGKLGQARMAVGRLGEAGIKWGGQHNAYQWGHAAVYLETYRHTLERLNDLAFGKYGSNAVDAKIKAYEAMRIDGYDVPVIQEFDRLVVQGNYKAAAEFLARASSVEVVSILGLGNYPEGWGTTGGRLFAQFGNWSAQMRSSVSRLAGRGTPKMRAAALARYAMSQAVIAGMQGATGLALGSWYLPYAGTLVNFGNDIGKAVDAEDSDETLKHLNIAAMRGIFGLTVGQMIYRGGPLANMAESAGALADNSDFNDAQAASDLMNNWLLGAPVPYVVKDIWDAADMASQGYSPFRSLARAIGLRSTKQALADEEVAP